MNNQSYIPSRFFFLSAIRSSTRTHTHPPTHTTAIIKDNQTVRSTKAVHNVEKEQQHTFRLGDICLGLPPSPPSSISGTSVSGASVSAFLRLADIRLGAIRLGDIPLRGLRLGGIHLDAIRLVDVRLRDDEGQDEWHRLISPRWKDMKTEGPSVSPFPLRGIRLCLSSLPSVSCNSTQVNNL